MRVLATAGGAWGIGGPRLLGLYPPLFIAVPVVVRPLRLGPTTGRGPASGWPGCLAHSSSPSASGGASGPSPFRARPPDPPPLLQAPLHQPEQAESASTNGSGSGCAP
jgi:hypothetical protein